MSTPTPTGNLTDFRVTPAERHLFSQDIRLKTAWTLTWNEATWADVSWRTHAEPFLSVKTARRNRVWR